MALRRRLLVCLVTAVLLGGGAALATPRGVGSIGANRLPLRSGQTTYRLSLDGRTALGGGGARVPVSPPGPVAPGGRYRLDWESPGIAVTDTRTGRVLTRDRSSGQAYWGPQGTLAFTDRRDGLTRLVIFDPATGARRVVASHLCDGDVVDPWSPDGRMLAIPVAPPRGGCNGHGGPELAIASPSGGGVRRIGKLGTMPVTWTRDGSRILVADTVADALRLVDPRTGRGGVALPSLVLPIDGAWSPGRRYYAAYDNQFLWILDGSLTHVVRVFDSVQQYAWAPTRDWLAIAHPRELLVVAVGSGRTVTVVPSRTAHGLSVGALVWQRGGDGLLVSAEPEGTPLGHD